MSMFASPSAFLYCHYRQLCIAIPFKDDTCSHRKQCSSFTRKVLSQFPITTCSVSFAMGSRNCLSILSCIKGTREWAATDFNSLKKDVETMSKRVEDVTDSFGMRQLEEDITVLETDSSAGFIWDDQSKAQKTFSALTEAKDKVKLLRDFKTQAQDAEEIVKLLVETDSLDSGLLQEASSIVENLNKSLNSFEFSQLLSGPYDEEGAVLYINAGSGGIEAQDWAEMLLRMYLRWGEKQGYIRKVMDKMVCQDGGIKSAVVEFRGKYAYGYLCGEKGTHRLIRNSPFNSKGLRQTSFSGVEVLPLLTQSLDIKLQDKDLDLNFSRSGGSGGQNVNKVESAVRITHIPTGVTVRCTEERTQTMNRAKALSRLKAKLLVMAEEQRASEISQIKGEPVKAEWGQQIRNYVFHPYKLVKDLRTGLETSNVVSVMDGGLDLFIKAYLKHKLLKAHKPVSPFLKK